MFFWNSLAFSMIQWMLAIWSLIPLPFLNPAWTSGSSQFPYCWILTWRILNIRFKWVNSEQVLNIVVVQLLSGIQLFVTPWTVALQASLFTISQSLLKLCPLISLYHVTISSSVALFSSCLIQYLVNKISECALSTFLKKYWYMG